MNNKKLTSKEQEEVRHIAWGGKYTKKQGKPSLKASNGLKWAKIKDNAVSFGKGFKELGKAADKTLTGILGEAPKGKKKGKEIDIAKGMFPSGEFFNFDEALGMDLKRGKAKK